jgi:hypothetical protein
MNASESRLEKANAARRKRKFSTKKPGSHRTQPSANANAQNKSKSQNPAAVRQRDYRARRKLRMVQQAVDDLSQQLKASQLREAALVDAVKEADIKLARTEETLQNTQRAKTESDDIIDWLTQKIDEITDKLKRRRGSEPVIRLPSGEFDPEFEMMLSECLVDGLRMTAVRKITSKMLSWALQRAISIDQLPSDRHAARLIHTAGTLARAAAFDALRSEDLDTKNGGHTAHFDFTTKRGNGKHSASITSKQSQTFCLGIEDVADKTASRHGMMGLQCSEKQKAAKSKWIACWN